MISCPHHASSRTKTARRRSIRRQRRERAEPVNVPDTAEQEGPDREAEADCQTGCDGEHDRDGTAAGDTVSFDVLEVLAVHRGGKDGDSQLDRELSGFADLGRVKACKDIVSKMNSWKE